MESEILKFAMNYGLFAVLFVVLFFYVIRTQEKRETRLFAHIEKSDEHIQRSDETLKEVSENVKEISKTQASMQKDIEILKEKVD